MKAINIRAAFFVGMSLLVAEPAFASCATIEMSGQSAAVVNNCPYAITASFCYDDMNSPFSCATTKGGGTGKIDSGGRSGISAPGKVVEWHLKVCEYDKWENNSCSTDF